MKKPIKILYEDDYIIAADKPPRMASVPSEGIQLWSTFLGRVQKQYADKGITPYLLHRLDMQTSGVLLFGKKGENRKALEDIFRDARTEKIYTALLRGVPRGDTLKFRLSARHGDERIYAETKFDLLKTFKIHRGICALVACRILTGRKHQIRQHFAGIGCPVVMDSQYGDERFNRDFRLTYRLGRQFLHAGTIKFFHPFLQKEIKIESPLAIDLKITLKRLGQYIPR
ncbi:MAG: ribosomal large subunit pseudouridine synthase C [Candidatus Peregrinibacteria bacterium GW2011_GWF2_43_17]|nr:MAG: ribosomal large subunit pseudouridine synthase C [Candidatus Peregrinibacteria bacterium GW2011_GWF2_43_17]KKT18709.1 MAG: Pseudouridine synthase [Candidatus Peregrinibacteria bacterium GW2011_GWA2_43_8]HAU40398.1 hypothetical protein [Candidatus Peregrinibacteria bacterium]